MTTLARQLHRAFPLPIFYVTRILQHFNYFVDVHFIIPLFVIITEL